MSLELSGTTGVKGVAGSVSAPSIVGDDTNTGISFPAADTIKFSTGGVERMQITNSGVTGTGISAGKILQVVQATTTDVASFTTSSSFVDGGLSATMTPTAASSKILVSYRILLGQSAGNVRSTRLARSINSGSYSEVTNVRSLAYSGNTQTTSQIHNVALEFLDTPSYSLGQTVAYRVEVNSYNSTLYRNQYGAGTGLGAMISTITLMEVAA